MIPIRLKLSGFLSYREPVELDFTTFELACISGANGAGKSSLLDAITWALFGQARKRDEALIHTAADAAEVTMRGDAPVAEQLVAASPMASAEEAESRDLVAADASDADMEAPYDTESRLGLEAEGARLSSDPSLSRFCSQHYLVPAQKSWRPRWIKIAEHRRRQHPQSLPRHPCFQPVPCLRFLLRAAPPAVAQHGEPPRRKGPGRNGVILRSGHLVQL